MVYKCELCETEYPENAIVNIVTNSGVLRACYTCLYRHVKDASLTLEYIPELECEVTGELGAVIYTGFKNQNTGKTERYILNPETMKRLLTYSLTQEEYTKLYIRKGFQFMIHDLFYLNYLNNC